MLQLSENIFCSILLQEEEITKKDILEKIAEFCNEAANQGYTAADIENAKYALCAWIDEYIYTNSSRASQWFSNSLALSEFNDTEAGKHFFDRMENFHKTNNSVPLLELYAKCILFGFMGKFRMGSEAELKQILNSAISKTKLFLEPLNYKPKSKTKRIFSFRRGIKNILITGNYESAKNKNPPKGYKFIYSDMKNKDELPFLDAIIAIDDAPEIEQKIPVYRVLNIDIPEINCTLDKNYEFNSNHLNYYLHKYFLDKNSVKNILSLPKKLKLFKSSDAFYTSPFFPFMEHEKPIAYSLAKRVFLVASLVSILFGVFIGYREKAKEYGIKIQKEKIKITQDSLKNTQDSLDFEFEKNLKNLEFMYKKQVLENFPFKEGLKPNFAEVSAYFSKDGEFCKFIDNLDTAYYNIYTKYDNIIQFNTKTINMLKVLKNNMWENIPVSVIVKAPEMAAVTVEIDSQFVEVERGKSKVIESFFPPKNKDEIVVTAKTTSNIFEEKIGGLLNIGEKKEISFAAQSYLIDVKLTVLWHLPKNSIHPKDWHKLKLEPLTLNQGE